MKTLEDLFVHQLQDMYSAETQLIEALRKMEENAQDSQLRQAFAKHLEETKMQMERIEEACKLMGIKPYGTKCKAIAGIIAEAEDFMQEAEGSDVMDAGLIANAQRVEHYEIAGYGTAVFYAKELGFEKVENLLKQTLREEKAADDVLNELALQRVNERAKIKQEMW